jgi:hypothetical protein
MQMLLTDAKIFPTESREEGRSAKSDGDAIRDEEGPWLESVFSDKLRWASLQEKEKLGLLKDWILSAFRELMNARFGKNEISISSAGSGIRVKAPLPVQEFIKKSLNEFEERRPLRLRIGRGRIDPKCLKSWEVFLKPVMYLPHGSGHGLYALARKVDFLKWEEVARKEGCIKYYRCRGEEKLPLEFMRYASIGNLCFFAATGPESSTGYGLSFGTTIGLRALHFKTASTSIVEFVIRMVGKDGGGNTVTDLETAKCNSGLPEVYRQAVSGMTVIPDSQVLVIITGPTDPGLPNIVTIEVEAGD